MCKIQNCKKPASNEPIIHGGYRTHNSPFCSEHTPEYKEMLDRIWGAPIISENGYL